MRRRLRRHGAGQNWTGDIAGLLKREKLANFGPAGSPLRMRRFKLRIQFVARCSCEPILWAVVVAAAAAFPDPATEPDASTLPPQPPVRARKVSGQVQATRSRLRVERHLLHNARSIPS